MGAVQYSRSGCPDTGVRRSRFEPWVAANSKDVVAPDCEKVVVFRGGTLSEYFDVLVGFYEESIPPRFYEGLPPCFFEF
jgi:hypothetical protein